MLRGMKTRYFLILAVLAAVLGVYGLRQNNQGLAVLIDKLVTADQAIQPTAQLREDIKQYSANHMGADATFELTASYNRDLATAQAAAAGGSAEGSVYAAAQAACAGKADSIVQAKCVTSYVSAHAAPASGPQAPTLPVRTSYRYSYHAPVWTPDLPGISFLAAAASLITVISMLAMRLFSRLRLQ